MFAAVFMTVTRLFCAISAPDFICPGVNHVAAKMDSLAV
jgi:hypothetical protein